MRVSVEDSDYGYEEEEPLSDALLAWQKVLASARTQQPGKVVIRPSCGPHVLSSSDALRLQHEKELEREYAAVKSYERDQDNDYEEACKRIDSQLSELHVSRQKRLQAVRAEAERKRNERRAALADARRKVLLEEERKARQEAEERAKEEKQAQEKAKEEAERKRRLEEERKKREAAEERERESLKQKLEEERVAQLKRDEDERLAKNSATDFNRVENEYAQVLQVIQRIKKDINAPVSADKQLKNHCFMIRMKLKPKFGQLTNSKSQLIKIRNEIKEIIQSAGSSSLVYRWTLNQYAKCVVQQAESEANVKVQAALPLAMLTILLWTEFPELGEFVISRFVKKCPYLIGYSCSIDTDEGRLKMRYRKHDAFWETEEQYGERMAGICSVWAAMTQSKLNSNTKHPYPMYHGWKFLSRQLNRPKSQVSNASYCTVAAWWDVSAMRFVQAYGKQGEKMLRAASGVWTEDMKFPSARRLKLLGDEWRRTNVLKTSWKPLEP